MTNRVLTIKHADGSTSPFQADTDAEVILILQALLKKHAPGITIELENVELVKNQFAKSEPLTSGM